MRSGARVCPRCQSFYTEKRLEEHYEHSCISVAWTNKPPLVFKPWRRAVRSCPPWPGARPSPLAEPFRRTNIPRVYECVRCGAVVISSLRAAHLRKHTTPGG